MFAPNLSLTQLNEPLIREVVEAIRANPEQWDQRMWSIQSDCGTTYCFAGWACYLAGYTFKYTHHTSSGDPESCYLTDGSRVGTTAQELLGLTNAQRDILFAANPNIDDEFVKISGVEDYVKLVAQVTGLEFKEPVVIEDVDRGFKDTEG